ncbi:MAG: bifunctional UDP-N-acetylglucosamine diphosphorylase/glucosamine-1-phosphate N-acetyltransferase GlmU, partial [Clostridia bacterium]
GVLFSDFSASIADDVKIGAGTSILPGVILLSGTRIGCGCVIGPNTVICGSTIADNVTINASQIFDSVIGEGTTVGPFAHIRNHCELSGNCRVGNFVELKNSTINNGSKMSHLSYIGDTEMGSNVNMGCGTITVNYDGVGKYKTVIGDNAFIGCNSNLIAPVNIGMDTLIAAGTTVHEDVPDGAMAISRPRQTTIDDAAERIFSKKGKTKK